MLLACTRTLTWMFDENRLVNLLVHGDKTKAMHRQTIYRDETAAAIWCGSLCVHHVFTNRFNSNRLWVQVLSQDMSWLLVHRIWLSVMCQVVNSATGYTKGHQLWCVHEILVLTDASQNTFQAERLKTAGHSSRRRISFEANQISNESSNMRSSLK